MYVLADAAILLVDARSRMDKNVSRVPTWQSQGYSKALSLKLHTLAHVACSIKCIDLADRKM